jgi:tol-pal system protein YbgF
MRSGIGFLSVVCLALGLAAGPGAAQGSDPERMRSLAEIRQQLVILSAEIEGLRRELSTSTGAAVPAAPDTVLTRIDAIEAELRQLTAASERLAFRIDQVVSDGTRRIADIELRMQDLAGGDLSRLPDVPPLGGAEAGGPAPGPARPLATFGGEAPQLAQGERAAFDRARAALDAGEFARAAEGFAEFSQTYIGGPLAVEAQYLRGEALAGLGRTGDAARAYLDAYTRAPDGPMAPDALLRLGESLAVLDRRREACVVLGELRDRFPAARAAGQAAEALSRHDCP